ncbi:glycosyltransferase [Candidatus Nitrospira nitrosa]|nr:glycosyltransferase [Candidatus Nitrospira nitrosa]
MSPKRILFLATGLYAGGAELMLLRLLSRLDRQRFMPSVISLIQLGPVSEKIERLGISVRSLGMQPGKPNLVSIGRLLRWIRQDRPHVMQTWMYHADLLGGVAARLAGHIPIAWGVRHSDPLTQGYGPLTVPTVKLCARLSRWIPKRIVCCSEASREAHVAFGYTADKMVVIPNGVDLTALKPDPVARRLTRQALGIPTEASVIGLVGRFHPQKDHQNFVCAAKRLVSMRPSVHFILCGEGVTWNNRELAAWIDDAGIRENCRLLGRREDVPQLMASFDLATSSSCFGESFANVVSEAMSCGVPCVVTDVGDSAHIVGPTGIVVPPRDAEALARAWEHMLNLGQEQLLRTGLQARQRIKDNFDLPNIVDRYQTMFDDLAISRVA